MNLPLKDKTILVTGVSRPSGIGAKIAELLALEGANVITHGFAEYDSEIEYSDSKLFFIDEFSDAHPTLKSKITPMQSSNLAEAENIDKLMNEAISAHGRLDGMVLNHAYSTYAPIGLWNAEHINKHLNINITASMLLIQKFTEQNETQTTKTGKAITLFTSGQSLGPMTNEIAYAVSKEAITSLCKQAAWALASRNIRVNCVNPGPTDTGYQLGEEYEKVKAMFPAKRWGAPDDAAKLVCFLHSDNAAWITGQIISSEGGFNRYNQ